MFSTCRISGGPGRDTKKATITFGMSEKANCQANLRRPSRASGLRQTGRLME